jgi:hypothetical protein
MSINTLLEIPLTYYHHHYHSLKLKFKQNTFFSQSLLQGRTISVYG